MITSGSQTVNFIRIYYEKRHISIFWIILITLKIINILKSFCCRFEDEFL